MTFHKIDDIEPPKQPKQENTASNLSEVEKARRDAEIQEYKTKEVKAKQEAVFAENQIKSVEDLKGKLKEAEDLKAKLGKEQYDWQNVKATEQSEIQKLKSEQEKAIADVKVREKDVESRERNLLIREKFVGEREELMNRVEKLKLKETEAHDSLTEQLKREYGKVHGLLDENAELLIKAGFRNLGYDMQDELDEMLKWSKNDIGKHADKMVENIKCQAEDMNSRAILMARDVKTYGEFYYNRIVDNLEEVYKVLPQVKPADMPKDE